MPETTPTAAAAKPIVDKELAVQLGRQLGKSLEDLAKVFQGQVQQGRDAREIGALFLLYRQRRNADGPRSPDRGRRDELDAMLLAAIHGYDTTMLSDLIVFGQWLADTAQPVWNARPVR